MNIFSNAKYYLIAIVTALIGGYVIKQKYDATKAESELKTIESKIVKTNIEITKKKAKAKAQSTKIETDIEIETLRELKIQRTKVKKEMAKIITKLEQTKNKKVRIEG